ncbi:MAG TPA: urea ABC transporter permease subunit UrtB, partial [Labilithrix sp.]|nr:urea ABC transporter permease subunit UrtB [Labilithrix sp.]
RREPPVDNAVRRALAPAIARLVLASTTSGTTERLAAIAELEDHDDALAALRAALPAQRDGAVRSALVTAIAKHDLASDDPNVRLEAVAAIERAGSVVLLPKLRAQLHAETDARVRTAVEQAIAALERKQRVLDGAASALYGLSTGSVLLLAALGLAITFGLMGVINMAHGEMLMLGAYATYATQVFFREYLPAHRDYYLVAAIPVAFIVCAAAGAMIERSVIRFLYGRPLETLLATWGVSLLVIQTVRIVFGAQNVAVENPRWLTGGVTVFEGVVLPYNRIAVIVFAALVVTAVAVILRKTSLGLRVRAVTQNRAMAACMGIATKKVDMWTFALGSAFGGLGGVALSQLGNVGPELGQAYIVDAFMVVVLGGVGKIAGTVVAAFALGIVDKMLEPIAGAVLGKIAVLLGIVLVIQKRPQGIFAPRGRVVVES